MKKFFFLAVAVTAMLTACSKTEITPIGEAQEIAFTAVNKVATKTPVEDGTFQTTDDMYVTAYIVDGSENRGNFFGRTHFTNKSGNIWTGNPARYWPLTTSTINFLAVTGFGGGASNSNTEFTGDFASGATVTLNDNSAYNQNDLMFAAGTGKHIQGQEYTTVPMVFKHALAWINFQVATSTKAENTENGVTTGCGITVNSIKLNGAVYEGTLTLQNGKYNEATANTTDLVIPKWEYEDNKKKDVFVPNKSGNDKATAVKLNSNEKLFGNGLLVVPNAYATSFTINYTITQAGGTANTFDYTYTLPAGTWEMAKKYFYNINITLSEIEIEPSITDWDASHTGVNTGVDINK